ncbi:mitochondrial amidoxime-reducing component 1 [Lucilia cuprina]|uniref:mitochondrial amidoxime-reducing component 1 n=1 Tax=Lucilia cuprina TaxID=7375 RepID=UPI001F052EF6|nr:mitochondrial amidoxime-reducing component 1 [Lucilia cuprina]
MSTSSAAANRALYIGLGLGATMLTGALSYVYYKYLKRDVMPLKWRRVGTLEQINLFPIKSCAPLEVSAEEELLCEVLGLRYKGIRDRALMLVNDKYEMITARVYPKLVLVFSKLVSETKLILSAEGMEPLELDFATLADEAPGKDIHTSVWGTKLDAMLCGEKYDKWFSRYILGKESGLHLVYYPYPKPVRSVNSRLTKEPFITKEDSGTFGDATSYMLMNLASVEDLNTRLPNSVDPLQFRGNFHLKMDNNKAYAEDKWQWVRIGDEAVFRKVAPCTRCIFPNINVKTGERDPNGNPLKELKSYRLINDNVSPTLGIHLGLRQAGTIKANDVIYVEDVE